MDRKKYLKYIQNIHNIDTKSEIEANILKRLDKYINNINIESLNIIDKGCLDLILFPSNQEDFDICLIDSRLGHDCYSHELESTLYYWILEGNGEFIIDNNEYKVSQNSFIIVPPNTVFYYKGKMKLLLVQMPKFNEKTHIIDKIVNYNQ